MKIGVDIVDLNRIQYDNKHFIERILSIKENQVYNSLKTVQRKKEYLGGRFAAKEAYLKACGTGIGGVDFRDIEILNKESGQPYLNDKKALLSISHERDYVVAFVVIED